MPPLLQYEVIVFMCRLIFLTFDWNYDTCYQFNKGAGRFVQDHPDTNVYIFNGFGKYGNQEVFSGNYEKNRDLHCRDKKCGDIIKDVLERGHQEAFRS